MKILADVNVSRRVVERLRERGFDATRVSDLLDPRVPDHDIIDLAREMQAVVVSHDQDMSTILALSGASYPSLVNLRVSRVEIESLTRLIEAVLNTVTTDLEAGAIVTVDDNAIRVHRLPIR